MKRSKLALIIIATGLAQFMAGLDNLVVTTALPVIRVHLHANLSSLEWMVNAYTLTFASLLLTGAGLGRRFGTKKIFLLGIAIFTVASGYAGLSTTSTQLITARAIQGIGGALMVPLSLTILAGGVPQERRNFALSIWGAIGGLAIAIGPLLGGAVVEGASWQWIFWLNVPVGLILFAIAAITLQSTSEKDSKLDPLGLVTATIGLFGVTNALINGSSHGWTSKLVLGSFALGFIGPIAFIMVELKSKSPMIPLSIFRDRGFSAINIASTLMSFGMFGSIFFLAQYFQSVQGLSPLASGVRILPWTAMPLLVVPFMGPIVDRFGAGRIVAIGLALQAGGLAWIASQISVTTSYSSIVLAFVISGIGMAMFFVPTASATLAGVPRELEGIASGVNNTVREVGGVIGIAVLGAIFSTSGGYGSTIGFVNGLRPAIILGAIVVLAGSIASLFIPTSVGRKKKVTNDDVELSSMLA